MNEIGMRPDLDLERKYRVVVQSPARLHFGLMEICHGQPMLYGGCGIALDEPSTRLSYELRPGDPHRGVAWQVENAGPWHDRIQAVLERSWQCLSKTQNGSLHDRQDPSVPMHRFRIDRPPNPHSGLGSGTQIACCVATLVAASLSKLEFGSKVAANEIWLGMEAQTEQTALARLAEATGRGLRSYIGLASHLFGGFLFDSGTPSGTNQLRGVARFVAPENWHVVLACPRSSSAVSGTQETDYFLRCAIPNPNRNLMLDLIEMEMIPAIQASDLARFGDAVYRYGRYGGELFRPVQGGVYRDAEVTELVDTLRNWGVTAVGQSSWGPTVYAVVGDPNEATRIEDRLHHRFGDQVNTMLTKPTNRPCYVSTELADLPC